MLKFGDGEDDESPYIGKARFKPNNFVMESNTLSGEQESAVYLNPMSSRHVEGYNKQNKLLQQEIHDALMLDLQGKEKAIKQGGNIKLSAQHVIYFLYFFAQACV